MANYVSVDLLKPHPKNVEYFSDPDPEEYEKIRQSIAAQGIRDPLKVLPDYTVIAGNLRLKVARDLGLDKVPVEVWDVSPEEAEYLLVADNEERRVCQDPVKKAKRAKFLKEYWEVKQGRPQKLAQNALFNSGKTLADIAQAVGESKDAVKRLLKLNDLIPPFQELVSRGSLSQTAAYSLAFLPAEEQKKLLEVLGESGVCGLSVAEAKELRRELEGYRSRVEELKGALAEAERKAAEARAAAEKEAGERLRQELAERELEVEMLKESLRSAEERLKARAKPDPKAARLEEELERLRAELAEARKDEARARLEQEIKTLESQKRVLEWEVKRSREAAAFMGRARKIFSMLEREEEDFTHRLNQVRLRGMHKFEVRRWLVLLERYIAKLKEALEVDWDRIVEAGPEEVSPIGREQGFSGES